MPKAKRDPDTAHGTAQASDEPSATGPAGETETAVAGEDEAVGYDVSTVRDAIDTANRALDRAEEWRKQFDLGTKSLAQSQAAFLAAREAIAKLEQEVGQWNSKMATATRETAELRTILGEIPRLREELTEVRATMGRLTPPSSNSLSGNPPDQPAGSTEAVLMTEDHLSLPELPHPRTAGEALEQAIQHPAQMDRPNGAVPAVPVLDPMDRAAQPDRAFRVARRMI